MFRGLYTAASGMITQNRVLDVTGNNLASMSTPGFKKEEVITSTFGEMMLNKLWDGDNQPVEELNTATPMSIADSVEVGYEQGALMRTDRVFDFALSREGFFTIQTPQGEIYTRNGSFVLDEAGNLLLEGVGQVMGEKGPIRIDSAEFSFDGAGGLQVDGRTVNKLVITDFTDKGQLIKAGAGMFGNTDAANAYRVKAPDVKWQHTEGSNVNAIEEITRMMSAQAAFKSYSQLIRIYDSMMERVTKELGRV